MKTFAFFFLLLLSACSAPSYLASNVLKVTTVTIVDGKQLVEVCGVNNKGEYTYCWYHTDDQVRVGDSIALR